MKREEIIVVQFVANCVRLKGSCCSLGLTIIVEPSFTFGELYPAANSANGESGLISSFTLPTIQKSFEFDDFETATFKSGSLIIGIDNQLKINWGGRSYRDREIMRPPFLGKVLPGWTPKVVLEEGLKSLADEFLKERFGHNN